MKDFFIKNFDWVCIILMVGICWFYGGKLLFTKIGFPAVLSMFCISIVLSFFLRYVLEEDTDKKTRGTK